MAEQVLTFRGITFNGSTNPSTGIYMLQNIPEGMHHPTVRQSESPLQNRHGIVDGMSYYGSRAITLTGKVIADTQSVRKTLEENLRAIFQLDGVQTGDNPSYYTLYMTDEDGEEKQLNVKISTGIEFSKESGNPYVRDFIVSMKARSPAWLSQDLYTEMIEQGKSSSSLTLPTTLPIVFGSTFINEGTVTNGGNFGTFPVITITGAGENPTIFNVTTNQSITINTTLVEGDELVIDCENGTVTLNGADALAYLSTDSQFIQLAAGANTIQVTDDSDASLDLDVQFEYRYAWI